MTAGEYARPGARFSIWVMRVVGVAASAYIGVLTAANIPNALNASGFRGTHDLNWSAALVLGSGVVVAVLAAYLVLRGSTPLATGQRLAIGLGALGLWLWVASLTVATAPG